MSDDTTSPAQTDCSNDSSALDTAKKHATPLLDELKSGPWPSFVTGLKRLRDAEDKPFAPMMNDLLGQLEHSYEHRMGFWKGGTVSVFGYGGGVIPRFSEVADKFPGSKDSTRCAFSRPPAIITRQTFSANYATSGSGMDRG